jgi:hypothetical protein
MENHCSLCSKCPLFRGNIQLSEDTRIMYTYHYCLNQSNKWKECKRYSFEIVNGQCPDFVMPNTLLSLDQISQKAHQDYVFES